MSMNEDKKHPTVVDEVNARHGRGTVQQMDEDVVAAVRVTPTGWRSLDDALGIGGWPVSRVIEVFGPQGSGRTTVGLQALAVAQRAGAHVAFVDMNHDVGPETLARHGLDLSRLLVSQPDNGEQALEVVEALARSGAVSFVVLDGVENLIPSATLEGADSQHFGLQARLMSQGLRKLVAIVARSNLTILFLNLLGTRPGVTYGAGETTSGGNALKFYASVRVQLTRVEPGTTKAKVVKNKLAPPFVTCALDLSTEAIASEGV